MIRAQSKTPARPRAKRARHLVVFLRAGELGRVKRRLAAEIGPLEALLFHRRTANALVRRLARDPRWRVTLAVTPDAFARPDRGLGGIHAPGLARLPQGPGDLGRRMGRVFAALPPGPAIIIGSDVPQVGTRHIARAFALLGRVDVVFGPAADGGYWLVGLRRRALARSLFRGVRWSSALALADTLANLDWRQKVALVERLDDVDDAESYRRWRAARRGGGRASGGDQARVTTAARRRSSRRPGRRR